MLLREKLKLSQHEHNTVPWRPETSHVAMFSQSPPHSSAVGWDFFFISIKSSVIGPLAPGII